MDARIHELAETLWRYHHMNHALVEADAILVLCSHDKAVAERGARLFLDGWAPLLIFSGGLGSITKHLWSEPEADQFARIAVGRGVPTDRILIENQSTNTVRTCGYEQLRRPPPRPADLHRRAEAVWNAAPMPLPPGVA